MQQLNETKLHTLQDNFKYIVVDKTS